MADNSKFLSLFLKALFKLISGETQKETKDELFKNINLYRNFKDRYKGLKSLKQLVASGDAIPVTLEEISNQFEKQSGLKIDPKANIINTIFRQTYWDKEPLNKIALKNIKRLDVWYRLPYDYYIEILERTPTDTLKYSTPSGQGKFICNDFGCALYSEFLMSPYYEAFVAEIVIKAHRINCIWPSDRDNIMYTEPQNAVTNNKFMWVPDYTIPTGERFTKDSIFEVML